MLTTSFAAGVDIKIVQEMLGHSTSSFTRDVYANSRELHQVGEKSQVVRSERRHAGLPGAYAKAA